MPFPCPVRPLTLTLSPSWGEGIEMAPSPSARERAGVRVGVCSRIIRASSVLKDSQAAQKRPEARRHSTAQAAEKGPDARRRAPRHPEAYFLYVEGCRKLAPMRFQLDGADGPFSAAC